ncbi:MAG: branched-chain amino acid ABC transporter permease, partial [Deltaproteobacteria bacterium]|nr:branched-chain amino acid ABC transporter permease [Deltaproteobacteria bacterium]
DEVFAVASGCPGMVGRNYLYGLILTPYIGWSFGTAVGAVAGNVLPAIVISALGIAIYGMFVAIVVPAMRKDRAVLGVTLCAVGLSSLFRYAPGLKNLSAGMAIVVCAVAASALFAWLRPLETAGEETLP